MLDLLTFVIPLLQCVELKVVGRLFMPDILLVFMLPILLVNHGKRLLAGLPRIVVCLAFLWLFGQIVTDVVRGTAVSDYARGWAKIIFTIVNFSALYLLIGGSTHRAILFAAGLGVGGLVGYFVNPGQYAVDHPWKFGYGAPTTWIIVFAAAVTLRMRAGSHLAVAILLAAGLLNMVEGFRSLGAICSIAAIYVFVHARWGKRLAGENRSLRHDALVAGSLVLAAVGVYFGYDLSARSGLLGDVAQEIRESQARGKYGLLVGGRSEILVSSRAILDSPFFGHGSWAKDDRYATLLTELRQEIGYDVATDDESGLIPTHSHLIGAWVEAGILGAVFWAWILVLPVRVLLRPSGHVDFFTPLLVFSSLHLVWDVLFSPYGAELRLITPFLVVVMLTYLGQGRNIGSVVPAAQ